MFFCFADPHFKKQNNRKRIINSALLSDYAYVLRPGGLLYTVTDVSELHQWQTAKLDEHPMFEKVEVRRDRAIGDKALYQDADEQDEDEFVDPCIAIMRKKTD